MGRAVDRRRSCAGSTQTSPPDGAQAAEEANGRAGYLGHSPRVIEAGAGLEAKGRDLRGQGRAGIAARADAGGQGTATTGGRARHPALGDGPA